VTRTDTALRAARRSEPDHLRVHDEPAVVDIAIVIPAFNETGTVGPTVERTRTAMASTPWTNDIIVVDDGSTDRTAEEAARHGARVIRLPDNRGYGAALKTGIQASRSEYVLIVDADGTYPPEMMPTLMAAMKDVDMVVGARAHDDRSIPRRRRLAKAFLRILASYLTKRRIPDLNSGLRLMRRSALMQFFHILPSGFSFTTTITLALLCNDYPVAYVPVACGPRVGASKLKAKEFTNFVMLVLRTVVLFNPLRVFLPAGTMIFAVGLVKLAYDLVNWNLSDTTVMAFLAALIVWSVGLLADMIARVQLHQRDT
jgi:glycosyltransferase involved in cell wall biosynthesis